MIHLLMIGALSGAAASDAPAYAPKTYEEQLQECDDRLRRGFPVGTQGYASVYETCRTLEQEALQRETGALIAEGKCAAAVNLALRAGDLQLAANIRAYCGTASSR